MTRAAGQTSRRAPRPVLERLLGGLWFAAFSAIFSSILFIIVRALMARIGTTWRPWAGETLLPVALSSLAYGTGGALRGWRLFRDPLEEADAFRIGAGVGAVAAAASLVLTGLLRPAQPRLHGSGTIATTLAVLLFQFLWTLGPAATIGAFAGWGLLSFRLRLRKKEEA